ncbi:stage II sporulation protein R [Paenibacillus sp. IITD108]|uniref:stage II sporulation protein R n=1 Tax=Paenibacillus sp. IITD108 TaxID=3116649 RepID=UPI002F3EE71B
MSHSYTTASYYQNYKRNRPYRFAYRSSYGFIVFAIILLIMSWESQQIDAAITGGAIPEEAIRLRILANSDKPEDQLVKRVVRDEIVNAMNSWAKGLDSIDQARETIAKNIAELEQIVKRTLESRGYDYGFKVELGQVEFPAKMYGNVIYPAGQYEALRISLGEAEGQNWWCVLFPPLCFVDSASGEASVKTASAEADGKLQAGAGQAVVKTDSNADSAEPEVKFFLWEILQSFINWIKSLF